MPVSVCLSLCRIQCCICREMVDTTRDSGFRTCQCYCHDTQYPEPHTRYRIPHTQWPIPNKVHVCAMRGPFRDPDPPIWIRTLAPNYSIVDAQAAVILRRAGAELTEAYPRCPVRSSQQQQRYCPFPRILVSVSVTRRLLRLLRPSSRAY